MANERSDKVNAKLDAILLDRGIDTAAIAEAREKGASIQEALDKAGMIAQTMGLIDENKFASGAGLSGLLGLLVTAGWVGLKKYKEGKA